MSAAADLEGRIAAAFDQLSPKQQTLARLILDNRYFASFASAAEIGEKVEASAATVVRLCQALGYPGVAGLAGGDSRRVAQLPDGGGAARATDDRAAR
jgi:DNA-binding MurR/RpiR family transcriptional regulator